MVGKLAVVEPLPKVLSLAGRYESA